MKDHPVPAEMAAAVIGSWRLGEGYRMTVSRSDAGGLHVHQEAVVRLKGRVVRDSPITYDPGERTLSFPGVGAIHRTIVTLRDGPRRAGVRLRHRDLAGEVEPQRLGQGDARLKASRSERPGERPDRLAKLGVEGVFWGGRPSAGHESEGLAHKSVGVRAGTFAADGS